LSFFGISFNRKAPKGDATFAKGSSLRSFALSLRTLRLEDTVYARAEYKEGLHVIQTFQREFLTKQGYKVLLAESGEKALEILEPGTVQVALIDLKMPGMDGVQTMKGIKTRDAGVLIILMTGYPSIESAVEALRSSAYDYVIKPFKLNELKTTIERAINEQTIRGEIDDLKIKINQMEGDLKKYQHLEEQIRRSAHPVSAKKIARTYGRISPSSEGSKAPDIIEQIRQLGALREQKVLSEEEFEKKKAELLNRL